MDVWKIAGVAVTAAVLCLTLRPQKPELALVLAAAAGAVVLGYALTALVAARETFARVADMAGLQSGYLTVLLKVLGVAYVTELAAQTCVDLGEGGLGEKVGLCGKLMIFALCAPLLGSLLELIVGMAP